MGQPVRRRRYKRQRSSSRVLVVLLACLVLSVGAIGFRKQQPVVAEKVAATTGVPYIQDTIPISNKRIGKKRRIKYIVVHNTANPLSTARNERDYLTNPTNTGTVSWHIAVDDTQAIEAIPVTEWAFHAGDREGNKYGIGVEICESGDYEQAEANAARVIAYLMKVYHIPIERVQPHQYFSGKECPRLILGDWEHFIDKIQAYEKQLHL